jgi:hypothetical protein
MKRQALTLLTASVLAAGAATATASGAYAATGATHGFLPETYDASEPFAAGEGLCVPWAGTFHEVRSGGYRLVFAPGGQQPGEVHVNGAVDGSIELTPDGPGLPTYAGTYREKVNGILTQTTPEGDLERLGQYRLRTTLVGTDGSTISLVLAGKVTFNARGVATVSRDVFTCG